MQFGHEIVYNLDLVESGTGSNFLKYVMSKLLIAISVDRRTPLNVSNRHRLQFIDQIEWSHAKFFSLQIGSFNSANKLEMILICYKSVTRKKI